MAETIRAFSYICQTYLESALDEARYKLNPSYSYSDHYGCEPI